MLAIEADKFNDPCKITVLLTVAGQAATDLFNTFELSDGDKVKYDKVCESFEKYCSPKKNETYERYIFRSRLQKQGETFDSFYTDLRLKAKTCAFDGLHDSMLRDQIVFGISDVKTRERLLREPELSLGKAISVCHSVEATRKHAKVLDVGTATGSAAEVGLVNKRTGAKSKGGGGGQGAKRKAYNKQSSGRHGTGGDSSHKSKSVQDACTLCGTVHAHAKEHCPAYGKTCSKCEKPNHFAKFCKTKENPTNNVSTVDQQNISEDDFDDTGIDELFIGSVDNQAHSAQSKNDNVDSQVDIVHVGQSSSVNTVDNEWIASIVVNETIVPMVLDTGAKANLITECDFKLLN
ncbi:uncharacterized protein LOC135494286 [Lineus longissimus]|uniref:uncharacterized protein LOC135494286 n=1 Tax=Lineus longissimus TaxID=88925 RepID=UPI00315D2DC0